MNAIELLGIGVALLGMRMTANSARRGNVVFAAGGVLFFLGAATTGGWRSILAGVGLIAIGIHAGWRRKTSQRNIPENEEGRHERLS